MRRAQSVRHYARPSLALATDDLGVLREGDETNEDVLRRQLLDKDRENDRLQTQLQLLQAQLAQRPPLEKIQELEKEYKNLDLILQGTQRENERCMAELERAKTREKMLERELAKLAGENWQSSLDIPTSIPARVHQRSNTIGSPRGMPSPVAYPSPLIDTTMHSNSNARSESRSGFTNGASGPIQQQQQQQQATLAHIEQVRMLILGMEQRLQTREDKLVKAVERAEGEGRRMEEVRVGLVGSA